MTHEELMQHAIDLSTENVQRGGQAYGAVVVKDGKIIGTGVNELHTRKDPTAHAELLAIQEASKYLNSEDLTGCIVYASGEPCPMCLAAIYWAKISEVYFAAEAVGPSKLIYEELGKERAERSISIKKLTPQGS